MFNGADAVRPVAGACARHHVVQAADGRRRAVYNACSAGQKAFFAVSPGLQINIGTEVTA